MNICNEDMTLRYIGDGTDIIDVEKGIAYPARVSIDTELFGASETSEARTAIIIRVTLLNWVDSTLTEHGATIEYYRIYNFLKDWELYKDGANERDK